MKYKKYILILLISLFIGCNSVDAANKTCYYIANDNSFKAIAELKSGTAEVTVEKMGDDLLKNKESIVNWFGSGSNTSKGGYEFKKYYKSGDNLSNIPCPKYLVFQAKTGGFWKVNGFKIYATEELSLAQKATIGINNITNYEAYYASYQKSDGTAYTASDYYGVSTNVETGGTNVDVTCDTLFDEELKSIINEILGYIRVIVPILVILLGTLDLAKAVLAGKEEEMRKAQKTFIMRVIAGVAVFFVPLLVDIVMDLANIVWEGLGYSSCNNF